MGGGASMQDLAKELGVPAIRQDGIVSDWIMARLGHTPVVDERLHEGTLEFNVRRLRRGKVFEVLISPVSVPARNVKGPL